MRQTQTSKRVEFIRAPDDLSLHVKGLYKRVARHLGLDPSYISQVARGEYQSEVVEARLRDDLATLVERVNKQNGFPQRAFARTPKKRRTTTRRRNRAD
jgi:hypothetical protein